MGENEKHFLMSDGSYQAVVYSYPVHELVDGVWVEIENTNQNARGDVSPSDARSNIIDNFVWEGHGVQNNNAAGLDIGLRSGYRCRAFIRFATMPTIPAGSTITAATMTVNIVSGTSTANNAAAYQVDSYWESATIQWSNMPSLGTLQAASISHNNKTKYQFSCLEAVKDWYNGSTTGQNENYGIMLRYADETINDYNSFYSADYSNAALRPSIVISYTPMNSTFELNIGATMHLFVTGVSEGVTWTSSEPTVASVTSNGVVTGIQVGTATITASAGDEVLRVINYYITLADGVYFIEQGYSNLRIGTNGSISEHTQLTLVGSAVDEDELIYQMWYIKHLATGNYCIRPFYKLDMALKSKDGKPGPVEMTTIGTDNTSAGVPNSSKWTVEYEMDHYVFYYAGTSSMTLRCSASSASASVLTGTCSASSSLAGWSLIPVEQAVSGAYLCNTYDNAIINENITKYVIYDMSTSLEGLNLRPYAYSTENIAQTFTWSVLNTDVASINSSNGTITGKKTGKTLVIGTPLCNPSINVWFEIVVVGPEQYSAGVRIATIAGKQYYDYTIPANNLFLYAIDLCADHRCMNWEQYCAWVYDISLLLTPSLTEHSSMQLASFLWYFEHVNGGEVWDIKLENRWEDAMPNVPYLGLKTDFVFRGEIRTAEDLGNIMYGYTGRAMGFGTITLYWGGGVAKQGSASSDLVTQPPLYGDDQNDHDMITFGFNLFNSDYPEYPEVGYDGIPLEGWIAEFANVFLFPES